MRDEPLLCLETCPLNLHFLHRYETYNWPWPLSNRDNVSRYRCLELRGSFLIYAESLDDSSIPVTTSQVRCWGRSICLISPDPETGGCTVRRDTIANPNGAIPAFVINKVAPRTARMWMEKFRNATSTLPVDLHQRVSGLSTNMSIEEFMRAGQ